MWWWRKRQAQYVLLRDILWHVQNLERKLSILGGKLMSQLDDLIAEVARNTEVDASAAVLIDGLATKIQELINASSGQIDPADLQVLVDSLRADNDKLSAAVAANTPQG